MAKNRTGSRRNAYGTPSSLTSLLSPRNVQKSPYVTRYIQPQLSHPTLTTGDRRYYRPDASIAPMHSVQRKDQRLKVSDPLGDRVRASAAGLPSGVRVAHPKRVAICARRAARREVLFAKKARIGSGVRKRNQWSKISCR